MFRFYTLIDETWKPRIEGDSKCTKDLIDVLDTVNISY